MSRQILIVAYIHINGNNSTYMLFLHAIPLRCYICLCIVSPFESGTQTQTDKQMIWVDHSPVSPFKDNIYVIWHNGTPVFVNRRTGPSGAWQTPIQVSGAETTGTGIGGDIKTNSFGDVFAFWPDTGSSKLFVAKSIDGGETFSTPVV